MTNQNFGPYLFWGGDRRLGKIPNFCRFFFDVIAKVSNLGARPAKGSPIPPPPPPKY